MPITRSFPLPASAQDLELPTTTTTSTSNSQQESPLYLVFVSSISPETGLSWCPDVRAAMPVIEAAFEKDDAPALGIVEVGQRPGWKELTNVYRTKWNVHNVPCLVRYEKRDGKVVEVGRLIEAEILDAEKLKGLLS